MSSNRADNPRRRTSGCAAWPRPLRRRCGQILACKQDMQAPSSNGTSVAWPVGNRTCDEPRQPTPAGATRWRREKGGRHLACHPPTPQHGPQGPCIATYVAGSGRARLGRSESHTSGAHLLPAQILEVFEVLGGLHLERGARPGFHDRALETEEPNFVCCKLPSAAFNLPVAARRQMTMRAPKDE